MKCHRCNGTQQISVFDGHDNYGYGPIERRRSEICPGCLGAGSLPDLVLEGKFSLEHGLLYFFNYPDNEKRRTLVEHLLEQQFPEIKDKPLKFRITIQEVD